MGREPDFTVRIVDENGDPDSTVVVIDGISDLDPSNLDRLRFDEASGLWVLDPTLFVVKAADGAPVNNSNVLVDDPELFIDHPAGTFRVESGIYYDSGTTPDLVLSWSVATGASGSWSPGALVTTSAASAGSIQSHHRTWGQSSNIGGFTSRLAARPSGLLIAPNAGRLQLRWSQQTADPSDSFVRAGSWLHLLQVAS